MEYRVVDLFAGVGGLRNGVQDAIQNNGDTSTVVFTSEIKKPAIATLQANHPGETIHGDITKIEEHTISYHDVLLAGFPCQAFSYAGNRLGFADTTKGTLFFDVARILKYHKPQFFVLENVEGLIWHDQTPQQRKNRDPGQTLNTILNVLQELGYQVDYWLLNAALYGTPQARKRIFIVGELGRKTPIIQPEPQEPVGLKTIMETGVKETNPKVKHLSDLLLNQYSPQELTGKFIRDKRGGPNNLHSWNFDYRGATNPNERKLLEEFAIQSRRASWAKRKGVKPNDGIAMKLTEISEFYTPPVGITLKEMFTRLTSMGYTRLERDGQYRLISGKLSFPLSHILDPEKPTPTIVATDATRLGVYDTGHIRRLTLTELKKLFGFKESFIIPESVSVTQMFDLFGNSVVSPVAEQVTSSLMYGKTEPFNQNLLN